jgi:hypothetical protein
VYEDVLMPKLKEVTERSDPVIVTNIDKVVSYLDHTWVGKREVVEGEAANGELLVKYTRTPPMFAIRDWNQHEAALLSLPRTNNSRLVIF